MIKRVALLTLLAMAALSTGANSPLPENVYGQDNGDRNTSANSSTDDQTYLFNVYFNDDRIGQHKFRISRTVGAIQVHSSARFVIKFLFLPIYKYEHVAEEHWQSGCLRRLESRTNDNGKHFDISLTTVNDQLLLSKRTPSPDTRPITQPCPATYAYWDTDLLRRGALINTQTGELSAARLVDHGVEELAGVAARRFVLHLDTSNAIKLWYRESDDQWIALETKRDGGTLSYRVQG